MSAEAPRNSGAGEPITPQRPEGGFSGFLGRLFGVPDQKLTQQSIQPPTPRVVQPPPGLEAFADRLQQGIDNQFVVQGQKELERKNAEIARIAAETTRKAEAEQRQRGIIEQERARREQATKEGAEILRNFRVSERLRHIQQTVWERKGQIRPLEPQFSSEREEPNMLCGLELVHHFPSVTREEAGDPPNRSGRHYRWRNMPVTGSMQLSVRVLKINKGPNIDKNMLVVSEDTISPLWMPIRGIFILTDAEEGEGLLEEALIKDSLNRVSSYGLPSQREREAVDRLAAVKRSEGWMKWVQESEPEAQ